MPEACRRRSEGAVSRLPAARRAGGPAGAAGQGGVARLPAARPASARARPAGRVAERGPRLRDADPAREGRAGELAAGRSDRSARPQGVRADRGRACAGHGVAGRHELAEARTGGVPSQAGRRRGGRARRPGAARGCAAARAPGRVGRRAAGGAGRGRTARSPGCCSRAWCCRLQADLRWLEACAQYWTSTKERS